MKRHILTAAFALCAGALSAMPACAQAPATPAGADHAPGQEALDLARKLVTSLGLGGPAAMNGMVLPIQPIIKQIGVSGPEQGRAVYSEAIMPVLMDHADAFDDIQVKTYATNLSVEDMKAAIAFYASPAGRSLTHAKAAIFQADTAAVSKYLPTLMPEFKARAAEVFKAHGWTKG